MVLLSPNLVGFQSYGSRCVKPPVIYGDVTRPEPMTVRWSQYAQSLTNKSDERHADWSSHDLTMVFRCVTIFLVKQSANKLR